MVQILSLISLRQANLGDENRLFWFGKEIEDDLVSNNRGDLHIYTAGLWTANEVFQGK